MDKTLDIKYLQDLYFDQSKILFDHQLSSFHQFVDEIIYDELKNEDNIFYENVDIKTGNIYKYGFDFDLSLVFALASILVSISSRSLDFDIFLTFFDFDFLLSRFFSCSLLLSFKRTKLLLVSKSFPNLISGFIPK